MSPTELPAAELVLETRPVAASVADLVADASERRPMAKGAESLSTATFERLVIDGDPYILKHLHCDDDWVMRATGDVICRPVELWRQGLLHALPDVLDHTVVGVATGEGRHGWGGAVLMHDVGVRFVPDDDTVISVEQHERFLDHMAALHARFWGFRETTGITGVGNRLLVFNDWLPVIEDRLQSHAGPPGAYPTGYANLAEHSPASSRDRPRAAGRPVAAARRARRVADHLHPRRLQVGQPRLAPRRSHHPRRLGVPGRGPRRHRSGVVPLGQLPAACRSSRESTIETYRRALGRHGVDTDGWWDAQLGLGLIGCFLQQGWSKAFDGRDDELAWWEERVIDATRYLA